VHRGRFASLLSTLIHMPPNAAHITPFLAHNMAHPGGFTLIPTESEGRTRKKNANGDLASLNPTNSTRRRKMRPAEVPVVRPAGSNVAASRPLSDYQSVLGMYISSNHYELALMVLCTTRISRGPAADLRGGDVRTRVLWHVVLLHY
jgi:hypothetical protein